MLFATGNHLTGFILRITAGIVLFPHACQSSFGLFGGPGFSGSMEGLTTGMGLPSPVAFLVIIIELLGSLGLILGIAGRFWAISLIGLFIGMIVTVHLPYGFFMNWYGKQAGGGFEYHLLVLGLLLGILFSGSGRYSVDRLITIRYQLAI